MKIFDWRKKHWYRQAMLVLTIILVVVLASHPELRLLLPIIDAMGLDLLLLLISAQFLDYVRPWLHAVHRTVIGPLAKRVYALAIFLFGTAGPYVDAQVFTCRLSRVTAV
jgi:hypothetical protein